MCLSIIYESKLCLYALIFKWTINSWLKLNVRSIRIISWIHIKEITILLLNTFHYKKASNRKIINWRSPLKLKFTWRGIFAHILHGRVFWIYSERNVLRKNGKIFVRISRKLMKQKKCKNNAKLWGNYFHELRNRKISREKN